MEIRQLSQLDKLLIGANNALRTVAAPAGRPHRENPAEKIADVELDAAQRAHAAGLMRVNHAGEVAAQALYSGQAVMARTEATRAHLLEAAAEEEDHLAWCAARIDELGGRRSALDPIWYGGSFLLGMLAGAAGDERSLGFIAETEDQVEAHISDHLSRLPKGDSKSRAILDKMAADEAHHGTTARLQGGTDLPQPVRLLMAFGGEILRRTALRL